MTLQQKTQDYEVLIRFNENGKIGMQRQGIILFKEGEVTLTQKLADPVPLSLSDLQALVASWTEADMYVPPAAK